ncbi:MAG: sulfotransferase [Cyanobacteria bacterium SBLK]|nr:sulfotransferase [Cyanobacteria bacterium SBLK]
MLDKPDFIVLGGHKCATTSLNYYLQQHPEIYLAQIKGLDFFNREGNQGVKEKQNNIPTTIEQYRELYNDMTTEKVAGEVSSVYLYSERACQTIKKYVPSTKLIAILRNPVDRALSNFKVRYKDPKTRNYQDIFEESKILSLGLYSNLISMYFEEFERSQIRIFLFDEVTKKPETFFPSLFEFIGVDPNFKPDSSVILRHGDEPKLAFLNSLLLGQKSFIKKSAGAILKPFTTPDRRRDIFFKVRSILPTKNYKKVEIPQDIKRKLGDFYQEDILKVQDLIGLDLSHWLNGNF